MHLLIELSNVNPPRFHSFQIFFLELRIYIANAHIYSRYMKICICLDEFCRSNAFY